MTSLMTSLTRFQSFGDQLPYVESIDPGYASTTAAWPSNNLAIFKRFRLAAPIQVNKMAYYVGSASGNVDLAVGTINPTTLAFVKLASTGSTAAAGASALQAIALTATIWLPAGVDLAMGMAASTTSLTVARGASLAAITANGQQYSKASSVPIADATLTAGGSTITPWFWLGYV